MREVVVSRKIGAPSASVWGVLAEFPSIAEWNSGLKDSYATGDQTEGVGATRHCDLKPTGTLEETIREWQPGEKLVISIDSVTKLPIRRGLATFSLTTIDDDTTDLQMNYEYEPRLLGRLMGGILDKQFVKGFNGFLVDLETEAVSRKQASDT